MQLTALDQKIMLAIVNLHPNAYGVSIQDHIRERTREKPPSIGSLYAALGRLEDRGFIKPRDGEATPERGGRAKVYFSLTPKGQAALLQSLEALRSLGALSKLALGSALVPA
ncbi:MAG TPA: PadR family transcriptional regulator [Pseudolabrys sp.]|nr:PadR family transcriptional regulator [Pseudolabrys sp.]